ncbi:putative metal-binding motif-containing protein [Flagellimonas myxillae]|uniref:putative metal-binding motif-containing protein n=1 Tax=Flagellimonas myxillae TaxID=2942214 RepID=UPI00201F44A2|nr:putative metal-binding motif-containing protein [Muricauda myxillae]MCL6265888.1 putative metal-binding motif-containing protein [Muricauda myxillae]
MKNISPKFLTIKPFTLYLFLVGICLYTPISCGKDKTEDPTCTEQKWYKDADGDDQGNASISLMACEKPDGYVANDDDPDDGDSNITSDCDMVTYYPDEDGDGFGKDGEDVITQCSGVAAPTDYVADNTDCDDSNIDINPDEEVIAYKDADGDGYGNPGVSSNFLACEVPEDYSLDNTDCDDADSNNYPGTQLTIYQDNDGDGFGNEAVTQTIESCTTIPNGYVTNGLDCNDNNEDIHPGAEETPGDEIDSNCDGIDGTIWNGPDVTFSKAAFADWTDPTNQDKLTENVIITRQDGSIPYNYQWWQDLGADAVHNGGEESDLNALYFGNIDYAINENLIEEHLQGGMQGIRWALTEGQGKSLPGYEHTFYSFRNLVTINSHNLYSGSEILQILDDFSILVVDYYDELVKSNGNVTDLVGKKVLGYIEADDIYFYLTFTAFSTEEGGAMSYTRSSPFTLD